MGEKISYSEKLKNWRLRLESVPILGLLVKAAVKGNSDLSKDMAASIAFFSFFSIFPLLLGLIAIATQFLDETRVQEYLSNLLTEALPGTANWVAENISALVRLKGVAGVTSVVMLFWSAKKMVSALTRGINNALEQKRNYQIIFSPIRNFFMTLAVSLLMLVPVAITPVLDIIAEFPIAIPGKPLAKAIDFASADITHFAFTYLVVMTIFRLLPYERLDWKPILKSSLIAATGFVLGKKLFLLYIANVERFEAIYGSVTSVIVLMLWLYFSGRLILYAAEALFFVSNKSLKNDKD